VLYILCECHYVIWTTYAVTCLLSSYENPGDAQEAAKKALQDAFKGKKDPFALDEEREKRRRGGGGGGGGGGQGGGGGGFGGGNMDFNEWGDKFLKWLKATLKAIGAALGFFTFIGMFYFWEPLLKFTVMLVRTVLRLDARKSQVSSGPQVTPDFSSKEELGNVEEAVISQWGGNEDVGFSDQEQEE
jgi:hypothetical protein